MTAGGRGESAFDLLLLDHLPGVGPRTVRRLVHHFGSVAAALEASDTSFAAVVGGGQARVSATARRDSGVHEAVRSALTRAEREGMDVVGWGDPRYPPTLNHLADPPPVLFLAGRSELLSGKPAVAVVGARRSTARARDVARRLGTALAREGVVVVSGLALGVDGAAHAGALRGDGATVAVLGAGVDVPYPRFHARLHTEIRRRGLLASEFPPGTSAAPHHFPRRNRILAALADAVVVVEAGDRSGALITVDHALDLGRDVWAVPGPIDTRACSGSNRLLADGARPLVSIDAFVAVMADTGSPEAASHPGPTAAMPRFVDGGQLSLPTPSGTNATGRTTSPEPRGPVEGSSEAERSPGGRTSLEARLLTALRDAPAQADELAQRFDEPIATILAVLTILELHGEVERLAGMRFRRAA